MKKMENNFVVSGYVAVDATVNKFENTSVARFPLSISRKETVKGEEVRKSALANVEAWRKNDNVADFDCLKKGALVTVEGYFKPEEYTDKDNKKHQKIIFNAVKIYPTPDKEE